MAADVATTSPPNPTPVCSVAETDCCIIGAGLAGVVLGLLLARRGVSVTLLEAHKDFDRYFRGDTLHSSVMELMDELDRRYVVVTCAENMSAPVCIAR